MSQQQQQQHIRTSPYRFSRSNSTPNSRTLADTFNSTFSDGSHILRRSANVARDLSNLAAPPTNSSQPRVRHQNVAVTSNDLRRNIISSALPSQNYPRIHQDRAAHYSLNSTSLLEGRRVTETRTPNPLHPQTHIQGQLPRAVRQSLGMPLHRGHHQTLESESDDENEDEDVDQAHEHEMRPPDDRMVRNVMGESWQSSRRDRQQQLPQYPPGQRSWQTHPHQFLAPPLLQGHPSVLSSQPSIPYIPVRQNTYYGHQRPHSRSPQQQRDSPSADDQHQLHEEHVQRPAFLSQPVYQLACRACVRPLCLRAMKAVMLSDHSKELYSTDMPPSGLSLVNEDRQVRHCACRIRDSACLGW